MTKSMSIFICTALLMSCNQVDRGENIVAKRDINTVLQEHTSEIMAIAGVTGLAISELEDKTPCIWVFVLEESEELSRKIPDSLGGHPVKVVVSGEIKTMDGS